MSIKHKCAAAIVVLTGTGLLADLIAPRPVNGAQPQTPQSVIVTNSSSQQVPVSATQSGTWAVGISGTPSMNIANLPSAPVPVRDVDASNRIQLNAQGSNLIEQLSLNVEFDPLPPSVSVLMDHVSFSCRVRGGVLVAAILGGTGATGLDYLPTPQAAAVLPGPGGSQISVYNVNTAASVMMVGGIPFLSVAATTSSHFDCDAYVAGHRLP